MCFVTFAAKPQPTILPAIAATINKPLKARRPKVILDKSVLSPMLAKNNGPKNIYEPILTRLSTYSESSILQRITPAIKAPVISATPNTFSAT